MMMHSNYYDTHERADIARLSKTYKLYRNGLFRTCRYAEAIQLLQTGEWFDKTLYSPKEEVLNYEQSRQRFCSGRSETSSEREESRHQQCDSNLANNAGEESSRQGDGSRSTNGEIKKRGRPKAVK